jgi:hypothetical protein
MSTKISARICAKNRKKNNMQISVDKSPTE